MKCEGFTRPECLPCPNEVERRVYVRTVEDIEEKRLCTMCLARLLPPLGHVGWEP